LSLAEVSAELRAWASTIVLPFVNLYILLRNDRRSEKRSAKVETKVDAVKDQTDGLTEHLVRKAEEVGHAAGIKQAEDAGVAKAATLEEGRQQGRDETKP